MKIGLTVTLHDGSKHNLSAGFADIIALERTYGVAASDLATRQRAEELAFLGWSALRRAKVAGIPDSFDAFVDLIEDLEPTDQDGPGNDQQPPSGE